jgi:Uma2 family endonuclease
MPDLRIAGGIRIKVMGTTVALMTVEEFLRLPDDESVRRELHDGEVFELTRPRPVHWSIQNRLSHMLAEALRCRECVGAEYSFRPEPQHQLWVADVAYVRRERVVPDNSSEFLNGSPDLVIEIESPSNTALEFERRESRCLRTGCLEFWIIYPELEVVRVATHDTTRRYGRGDVITLNVVEGVQVAVDEIFAATGSSDDSRP